MLFSDLHESAFCFAPLASLVISLCSVDYCASCAYVSPDMGPQFLCVSSYFLRKFIRMMSDRRWSMLNMYQRSDVIHYSTAKCVNTKRAGIGWLLDDEYHPLLIVLLTAWNS